ncbi:hypothetical protein KSP39_PZI004671 [Platanthera zijinensis]|uniref:Secreted protein n=1 Tax=Platanthera zijinensis TaxID=2320716 RepID=A0AAP0BUI3_9ASPA
MGPTANCFLPVIFAGIIHCLLLLSAACQPTFRFPASGRHRAPQLLLALISSWTLCQARQLPELAGSHKTSCQPTSPRTSYPQLSTELAYLQVLR